MSFWYWQALTWSETKLHPLLSISTVRSRCRRVDISYSDGLVQERRNSSSLTMELRLFCTKPSILSLTGLDVIIEEAWISCLFQHSDQYSHVFISVTLSVAGLDMISEGAWPALGGFSSEVLNRVEVLAIGPLWNEASRRATHTVIHTTENRTYIRGSHSIFHLCKYQKIRLVRYLNS